MQHEKPLTFGSLFAGIGGLDLGFERAGLECKWQVEIDEYCRRVLAKHWPDVQRHDDIRTWPSSDAERVDVIAGGFPCQDISYAGKRAGLAGERSGLFYELIRVVREMAPRVVVLENVAALLTRGLGDVLGTLASIGFDAEWHCIPAYYTGAPHIRDRVFVVAYADGRDDYNDFRHQTTSNQVPSPSCHANGKGKSRLCFDEEMARLHGIPKAFWTWPDPPQRLGVANGIPNRVDRLRGLGNAVVPQVGEYIANAIVRT